MNLKNFPKKVKELLRIRRNKILIIGIVILPIFNSILWTSNSGTVYRIGCAYYYYVGNGVYKLIPGLGCLVHFIENLGLAFIIPFHPGVFFTLIFFFIFIYPMIFGFVTALLSGFLIQKTYKKLWISILVSYWIFVQSAFIVVTLGHIFLGWQTP